MRLFKLTPAVLVPAGEPAPLPAFVAAVVAPGVPCAAAGVLPFRGRDVHPATTIIRTAPATIVTSEKNTLSSVFFMSTSSFGPQ
jgi:hypothetical protein